MELPEVARDAEVAAFIGSTKGALAQDRHRGRGIPYVRIGASLIRYLRADVLNYLNENRVVPTDGKGNANSVAEAVALDGVV